MTAINWPRTGSILLVGDDPSSQSLALEHAKEVLCEGSERSAALLEANAHPDFRSIHPESGSLWIKVDQIRELITWSQGKPQISSKQVAIISPAHTMNVQAANALLKTLEEPSLDAVFILVSDKPTFIPATIRSRCYWIRQRTLAFVPEISELKEMIVKDLAALKSQKDNPISVAARWVKQDAKQVLYWLLIILNERCVKNITEGSDPFTNNDKQFWRFVDSVIEAKRSLEEPNHPNNQLLFESLLIEGV